MSAKKHYNSHLRNFYSWMIGDFSARSDAQQSFFTSHDILPYDNRIAVDLGCGNGIQSVELAILGFDVIAVDLNNKLIKELRISTDEMKQMLVNSGFSISSCETINRLVYIAGTKVNS